MEPSSSAASQRESQPAGTRAGSGLPPSMPAPSIPPHANADVDEQTSPESPVSPPGEPKTSKKSEDSASEGSDGGGEGGTLAISRGDDNDEFRRGHRGMRREGIPCNLWVNRQGDYYCCSNSSTDMMAECLEEVFAARLTKLTELGLSPTGFLDSLQDLGLVPSHRDQRLDRPHLPHFRRH